MINLRYHIVSITAVFLALGIGTALGGTFLDRYTVDVLDRNIRSAEARIRDTESENADLEREIGEANARNDALVQTGSSRLFAGQLEDVPVLIVTSEGVDADVVTTVRTSLVRSDADVRGTLELRNGLALSDDIDADLADAVDADPSDPDAVRSAVQRRLREAFSLAGQEVDEAEVEDQTPSTPAPSTTQPAVTEPTGTATTIAPTQPPGTAPEPGSTTTTVPSSDNDDVELPDGDQPEIVTTLLGQDLLRLSPGPGYEADDPILEVRGYRYVFIGGPALEPDAARIMLAMLPTPVNKAIPAVVVSATVPPVDPSETEPAPTVVSLIRVDSERATAYTTVDGVDTFAGLTAMVLSVRDLPDAERGHYGQAAGSSAVLPGAT